MESAGEQRFGKYAGVAGPDERASGSVAWDLRCYVREKLIGFIQKNYPESLPRTRAAIAELGKRSGHSPDARQDAGARL